MYVLIIARGYPTDKYKMNGIFEFDQAKALAKEGHKVIYAAVDVRSIRRWRKWGFNSFMKDGVRIEEISIPCGRIPKTILKRIRKYAFRQLYRNILEQYGQPDIIHAHFIGSGYLIAELSNESRGPLVLTEHFSGINQKNMNSYLYKLGKYTYPRMNKVIAVSSYLAKNIKHNFGIDPLVIPNIVDTTNFKYKSIKKNWNNFNFISTGSLLPNKRMDMLIEAFYKAFHGNKQVQLYIFGEGPERKKLEKLIVKYEMTEQIFLMGLVNRKIIANKMSQSDCFVLVSRLETFGVAYIEAMAMGLPVIATKNGGSEDFITEENGLLVPVDDEDRLIHALKAMYTGSVHYNNQEISNSVVEKFGADAISNKLIAVYKELLDEIR